MDENKNLPQELEDNDLDKVAGGKMYDEYLDEVNLPGGWMVTCYDCGAKFYVSQGKCPKCGSTHVLMTN